MYTLNHRGLLGLTFAATLLAVPGLALAQADGTPGNPAGTAVGRAVDRATGSPTVPDGAPGNPAGTATGRAVDRATGTPINRDGVGTNPPGTALDRAAERAGDAARDATAPARPGTALNSAAPGGAVSGAATSGTTMRGMAERQRVSQIIGARVYNDRNEAIGEVDDLLLTGNSPTAIISVGGFLGLGARLVAVPLTDLQWNSERERMMLPGATKEQLQNRPAFDYNSLRRS